MIKRELNLLKLLGQNKPLRFLEAHNGISALIIENAAIEQGEKKVQFDGIWVSSFTDSASRGLPDAELSGPETRCLLVDQIANLTTKPIIVDVDTGGSLAQFQYYIKSLERIGASAAIVEDKVFPKRNSLDPEAVQSLEEPRVFAEKLKLGKTASSTKEFMIIARIESLMIGTGHEDALKRAKYYIEAGADGIMIHSRSRYPDEILRFAGDYGALCKKLGTRPPLVCAPTTYNLITDDELGRAGFDIIIHANQMLRSSYKAMKQTAELILLNDRGFEAETVCAPVSEVFRTVGLYKLREQDSLSSKVANLPVIIPAAAKDPIFQMTPKSLIQISGKTILDNQLEVLRSVGLKKIIVVRGFEGSQFNRDDVTYVENEEYEAKHSLHSLFCAKDYMTGGFLLVFSDILFNADIIKKLLSCDADIVLVVDNSYRFHKHDIQKKLDLVISQQQRSAFYRTLNPTRMIQIRQIGKGVPKTIADHEFVGIAYFSENVAELVLNLYEDCEKNVAGRFHEAASYKKAGITDFFQELIDRGALVNGLEVFKGWMEVHSLEDVKIAEEELSGISRAEN
jgi:phosphoenolpyruvate phosphomutase